MKSKSSKQQSKSTKNAVNAEAEWGVADEGVAREQASAEPRVELERTDEPELDVVQHAPDEPTWHAVEPADASKAAAQPRSAKKPPRAARAKPERVEAKARNVVANDVTDESVPSTDAPAPIAPKRAAKRSATQADASAGAGTQGDAG